MALLIFFQREWVGAFPSCISLLEFQEGTASMLISVCMVFAFQVERDEDGYPTFNVDDLHLSSDDSDTETPAPAAAPVGHFTSLSARIDQMINGIMHGNSSLQHAAPKKGSSSHTHSIPEVTPPKDICLVEKDVRQKQMKERQPRAPRKRKTPAATGPKAKRPANAEAEGAQPNVVSGMTSEAEATYGAPDTPAELSSEATDGRVSREKESADTDDALLKECMKAAQMSAAIAKGQDSP
eukprot:3513302-Karenia_brevis.AAC.1